MTDTDILTQLLFQIVITTAVAVASPKEQGNATRRVTPDISSTTPPSYAPVRSSIGVVILAIFNAYLFIYLFIYLLSIKTYLYRVSTIQ